MLQLLCLISTIFSCTAMQENKSLDPSYGFLARLPLDVQNELNHFVWYKRTATLSKEYLQKQAENNNELPYTLHSFPDRFKSGTHYSSFHAPILLEYISHRLSQNDQCALWDPQQNRQDVFEWPLKQTIFALNHSGTQFISQSNDDAIILWDIIDKESCKTIQKNSVHRIEVQDVMYSPDDKSLIIHSQNNDLILRDIETNTEIRRWGGEIFGYRHLRNHFACHPHNKYIAFIGAWSHIFVCSRESTHPHEFTIPADRNAIKPVYCIACSHGKLLALGSYGEVTLVNIEPAEPSSKIHRILSSEDYYDDAKDPNENMINTLIFSSDDQLLAACNGRKQIIIWNVAQGNIIHKSNLFAMHRPTPPNIFRAPIIGFSADNTQLKVIDCQQVGIYQLADKSSLAKTMVLLNNLNHPSFCASVIKNLKRKRNVALAISGTAGALSTAYALYSWYLSNS